MPEMTNTFDSYSKSVSPKRRFQEIKVNNSSLSLLSSKRGNSGYKNKLELRVDPSKSNISQSQNFYDNYSYQR